MFYRQLGATLPPLQLNFLKNLLGTHSNVLGSENPEAPRPQEVAWRDTTPEGKLDLLVTLDFRMSTTCLYSDIVLPTATWYEKNDLNTSDMHPFIHPLSTAVDPAWQSRSDWEIYKGFARKFSEVCVGHLGVEPLNGGFELEAFQQGLRKRKTAIKQVLLGGALVVGVGNIYASEALFLAGIRPATRADRISRPRAAKLRLAIIDVLARAVKKGGSTLRDFSNADGQQGYFQLEAHVYDRAGEPCRVCGTTIRRIQQGQRSTYYCPTCQKP